MRVNLIRLIVLATLCHAGFAAADFTTGDLYLCTAAAPGGPAVLRIDPFSGAVTTLADGESYAGRPATYDPFRDRIILVINFEPTFLRMIDDLGNKTELPINLPFTPADIASAGDGRLYFAAPQFQAAHWMLTPDGQSQPVLDHLGDPLITPGGAARIIFDAGQNALFVITRAIPETHVRRFLLDADGDQALGPADEFIFAGTDADYDDPMQLAAGPNGTIFYKIDDNTNSAQARMQLIDPVNLTATPYAVSEYFGVGGEVAGTYSTVRDQAVVLDSFDDHLRVFSFGAFGEGAILASGVSSAGGTSESAKLLSIGDTVVGAGGPPPNPADFNNDGVVDAADLASLLANWGPCPGCPEDLDGDGDVDAADLAILLANWGT